jgi:hypothetical protein
VSNTDDELDKIMTIKIAHLMIGKPYPNIGEIIEAISPDIKAHTDKAIEAHTRSELVWILGYEGKDDSLTLKRIKAYAKKHLRDNK